MANELSIIVGATDKASGVLGGISNKIEGMGKKMQKTGLLMMGAGTVIVGALIGITMKTAQAGDAIAKMSKRTGLGTVALSELRYAADLSGTSLEGLETGMKRMSRVLVDASDGLESAIRPLDRLGLSVEGLMGLSPEEQFYKLAGAIAGLEDPTIKAAVAQEIFGRAGTDLLPMLADGAQGLEKMREEAHKLGVIFDEEAAKKAEAFQDAMTRLKASFQKAGAQIGEVLMPILTNLLENKVIPIINKIADWIGKNEALVITLLKIGAALVVGGAILVGLGMVAKAIMAINAALIIMHSLTGVGILKMLAGLAIAAGAIAGMYKLMETPTTPTPFPEPPGGYEPQPPGPPKPKGLFGFQFGGIVPGPIGRPIPIIAHGGEEFLGAGGGLGETNVYLTIQGSVVTEQDLITTIREEFLKLKARNVTTGF